MPCTSLPCRDRILPAHMGPAGKFLDIRQGDRTIEDYAGDFVGMARQSATEKTCLMVIFWGGLADPFKSMMPYWAPEESLEDYINLALQLSGSAFRVELAAEPATEAAIKGALEASSAAPSTSSPLPERPGLISCVQEPPLMFEANGKSYHRNNAETQLLCLTQPPTHAWKKHIFNLLKSHM
ncbi:hypothetical protein G5714_004606 [Onychostoma macrolepis]|uniref:Retrotransposon gag domain-containing protein n=1 Tax=Onychostoma macrolepis TaxID=369639 RepID=A0A7J6D542_9TELE|nr:hypothetical protein G5714_004606 [Onychostoma macrolepis]